MNRMAWALGLVLFPARFLNFSMSTTYRIMISTRPWSAPGTFTSALHAQLIDVVTLAFAAWVAHVDRNSNLSLMLPTRVRGGLPTPPQMLRLWVSLSQVSFRPESNSAVVTAWKGKAALGSSCLDHRRSV